MQAASITINGKKFEGKSIRMQNGVIEVDGVIVDGESTSKLVEIRVLEGVANIQVAGDLVCEDIRGAVHVGGDLKAKSISGPVTVEGDVECGDISGPLKAGGDVKAGRVQGSITAGGDVSCSGR